MQPKRVTALSTIVGVGLVLLAAVGYAGEIVLDVPVNNGQGTRNKAGENAAGQGARNKAGENAVRARMESNQSSVSVLPASGVAVDLNSEESFFPQHGDDGLPNAHEQRTNAKERESNTVILPRSGVNDGILPPDAAARKGVADNVSKARAYMKNTTSQRITELPVVSCENVNNVTGRIGDDSQSGSIITIMINGKQVRARCK